MVSTWHDNEHGHIACMEGKSERKDMGKKGHGSLGCSFSHLLSPLRRLFVSSVVSLFVIFVRYTNIATTFAFYFASNNSRRAVFILPLLDIGARGWVSCVRTQGLSVSYLTYYKRVVIGTQRTRNEL